MKIFTTLSLLTSFAHTTAGKEKPSSLRGVIDAVDVSFDFSEWKCTFEAFSDGEKCAESLTADGDPCSFCSVDSDGDSAGLCVTPELADKMEQINPGISCGGDRGKALNSLRRPKHQEDEDAKFDFSEWKCTMEAFSDEEKCADSLTADGDDCDYCTIGDEDTGLCVTPSLADKMKQVNPQVECSVPDMISSEIETDVDFDFSEWKCTIEAFSNEEKCATSLTADGDACKFCSIESDGEEAGLCVTPSLAEKMEQVNPQVECSVPDIATLEPEESVDFDFSEWKCTIEAFSNEDKCASSLTADGDACKFCSIESDGEESGLCVTPSLAEKMEQVNPQVECSIPDKHVLLGSKDDTAIKSSEYECSTTAFTDAEACSESITSDGQQCEFCSLDGPFGPQGICVSPDQADLMKQTIPFFKCSSEEKLENNPITDCNISGANIDLCLDPSKVNGSECIWCDAGIGGFCFPKSWEEKASRFLDCTDSLEEKNSESPSELDLDPDVLKSSCLKNGFTGSSPDNCREAIDEATGEHCVFCSSPNLDGIGICMPSSFKGKESHFYTCDAEDATAVI